MIQEVERLAALLLIRRFAVTICCCVKKMNH